MLDVNVLSPVELTKRRKCPLKYSTSLPRSDPRHKAAAAKNAYHLLGTHRYSLAAAFFVLAGAPADAATVCARSMGDPSLAVAVARLGDANASAGGGAGAGGGGGESADVGPSVTALLDSELLPAAAAAGDAWMAHALCWRAGRTRDAVAHLSALARGRGAPFDRWGVDLAGLLGANAQLRASSPAAAAAAAAAASGGAQRAAIACEAAGLALPAIERLASAASAAASPLPPPRAPSSASLAADETAAAAAAAEAARLLERGLLLHPPGGATPSAEPSEGNNAAGDAEDAGANGGAAAPHPSPSPSPSPTPGPPPPRESSFGGSGHPPSPAGAPLPVTGALGPDAVESVRQAVHLRLAVALIAPAAAAAASAGASAAVSADLAAARAAGLLPPAASEQALLDGVARFSAVLSLEPPSRVPGPPPALPSGLRHSHRGGGAEDWDGEAEHGGRAAQGAAAAGAGGGGGTSPAQQKGRPPSSWRSAPNLQHLQVDSHGHAHGHGHGRGHGHGYPQGGGAGGGAGFMSAAVFGGSPDGSGGGGGVSSEASPRARVLSASMLAHPEDPDGESGGGGQPPILTGWAEVVRIPSDLLRAVAVSAANPSEIAIASIRRGLLAGDLRKRSGGANGTGGGGGGGGAAAGGSGRESGTGHGFSPGDSGGGGPPGPRTSTSSNASTASNGSVSRHNGGGGGSLDVAALLESAGSCSSDGYLWAAGKVGWPVRIWEAPPPEETAPLLESQVVARCLASHPVEGLVAAGAANGHAFLWRFGAAGPCGVLGPAPAVGAGGGSSHGHGQPHAAPLTGVAWDPHGHRVAATASDGALAVWRIDSSAAVEPPMASLAALPGGKAESVSFARCSTVVAVAGCSGSGGSDASLSLWDLLCPPRSARVGAAAAHSGGALALAMLPGGPSAGSLPAYVATGGTGGDVAVFDLRRLSSGSGSGSGSGGAAALGSAAQLWRSSHGDSHTAQVATVAAAPWLVPGGGGGGVVASGCRDGDIRLFDARSGRLLQTAPQAHSRHTFLSQKGGGTVVISAGVTCIVPLAGGFLSCGADGTVKLHRRGGAGGGGME